MKLYNAFRHLVTITRHKLIVMDLCFKLGLIRQGLLHDLSKYSPVEFAAGTRYYQGVRSPNAAERIARGYSAAWLHHKGRNLHHYEYWMDVDPKTGEWVGCKMPLRYVLEMLCDRIAASRVYNGKNYADCTPWNYYSGRKEASRLHPETRALLEKLLLMLCDRGEKYTLGYMRWLLKHPHVYERFLEK
ncbi:MAG: DUF5662 family protein [Stomatobaculum sp.]